MQQKKRRLGELSQMFTTAAFVFHQHFSKMKTCLPVLNLIPGETKKMCRYWMAYSLKLGMKSVLSELEIQQKKKLKKKKKTFPVVWKTIDPLTTTKELFCVNEKANRNSGCFW